MRLLSHFLLPVNNAIVRSFKAVMHVVFNKKLWGMGLISGMGLMFGFTGLAQSFHEGWPRPELGHWIDGFFLDQQLAGMGVFRPNLAHPANAFLINNDECEGESLGFDTNNATSLIEGDGDGNLDRALEDQTQYNLHVFLRHWDELFDLNEEGIWDFTVLGRRVFFELQRFQLLGLIGALRSEILKLIEESANTIRIMVFTDFLNLMEAFVPRLIDDECSKQVFENFDICKKWFDEWHHLNRVNGFFKQNRDRILLTDAGKRWFLALTVEKKSMLLNYFFSLPNIPEHLKRHLMNVLKDKNAV